MNALIRAAICAVALIALGGAQVSAQQNLTVIRVAGVQTDDITPLIYAIRTGMFAKAGLDVQSVATNSGAATAAAVASGTYEVGKSSLTSLMNAHLKNVPLVVIAAGVVHESKNPFAKLVALAGSPYQTGKDFAGKTIAVSSLNDLSSVAVESWIDKTGGDVKSVRFVELPVSAMQAAVTERRVDAAFILYPALAEALASGKMRVVSVPYDAVAPFFVLSGWFTTADYAEKHPEAVRAFVHVMYEAAAFANRHPADTAAMMSDVTKVPMSIYSSMARVGAATSTNPKDWQPLIDSAAKYGVIPHPFPAKDFIWSSN